MDFARVVGAEAEGLDGTGATQTKELYYYYWTLLITICSAVKQQQFELDNSQEENLFRKTFEKFKSQSIYELLSYRMTSRTVSPLILEAYFNHFKLAKKNIFYIFA